VPVYLPRPLVLSTKSMKILLYHNQLQLQLVLLRVEHPDALLAVRLLTFRNYFVPFAKINKLP